LGHANPAACGDNTRPIFGSTDGGLRARPVVSRLARQPGLQLGILLLKILQMTCDRMHPIPAEITHGRRLGAKTQIIGAH
jgi:hypothetical protein